MSLLKKYQKKSKEDASKLLESSLEKMEAAEASFAETFSLPSLSAASAEFAGMDPTKNERVSRGVSIALDAISSVSQDARTVENYIHLHIPKMEDGNNFGVTVQLALLKQLSEVQEAASKQIDEVSGYASARADALEKLKLPSSSVSVTKSTSTTTTDGKKEEKNSEATEEKESKAENSGPVYESRVAALVAVDTLYYSKAQRAFQSVMTLYVAALDFLDKNKEKLEKPKGTNGGGGFASMY